MARNATPEPEVEREATPRVVFRREQVVVIPEGVTFEDLAKAQDEKALKKLVGAQLVEAWVEVDRKVGSQQQAIEAHAGKPMTPEAKPGVYRTTPARSWKGGKRYTKPPEAKVEAEDIE